MKKVLLLIMVIFAVNMFAAFYETEEWTLIEETPNHAESMHSIAETADGNFVVTGKFSTGEFTTEAFLKKVDVNGNVLWTQTYSNYNSAGYVEVLSNGNILFVTGSLLVRVDSAGNFVSSDQCGFSITSISKTNDGYILLSNYTSSIGYFSIKRVDNYGNPLWTYYLDNPSSGEMDEFHHRIIDWDGEHDMYDHGPMLDSGHSIAQTSDGGFIITGWTYQGDGSGKNVYLVKTDGDGVVEWESGLGGDYYQEGNSVIEDSDGNFVIAGYGVESNGIKAMIMKTDSSGNIIWTEHYGFGRFHSIIESTSGGYVAVGKYVDWNDQGYPYIVRTNEIGNSNWSGFTYYDEIYGSAGNCIEDSNGDYLFCGWSDPDYYHIGTSNTYMAKYSEIEDLEIVVNEVLPFEPDWETNTTVYAAEDAVIHFEIDAYDPDGTELSYEWYLNEETVVSSDYSYDFDLDTTVGESYYLSVNIWDGFSGRDGERSNLYYAWEIIVVGAEPGTGNGGATGGDPAIVPVEPIDLGGAGTVNPDVTVDPDGTSDVTVEVTVLGDAQNPGAPGATISYGLVLTGTGGETLHMTLNFDGLSPIPNQIYWWNNGSWVVPTNISWAATYVTFDITMPGGRDGNTEVVLGNEGTLPVELSSFTAQELAVEGMAIQLNWATESETELDGFNVYRNIESNLDTTHKLNTGLIDAIGGTNHTDYNYVDNYDIEVETEYFYWLQSQDLDGTTSYHGPATITTEPEDVPEVFENTVLHNAYPNPFNPSTKISFEVKEGENATLEIFNARGQLVKTVGDFDSGRYIQTWNGKDNNSNPVASGIYFYRLKSESYVENKRMILLK
ncbi:MAG: T9SS type A sorting domain-containing protein [Candidatus Cloacimonadota bacterium]|nr:T9SS type A sorting domain-containing protein [Candidatus Cloacimonadota bacterium]